MARVRFRPQFYIMAGIFLLLILVLLYFLVFAPKEGEIETGTIRLLYDAKSVIIRDEQSVAPESYDKVLFDVVEGARVSTGQQIAQVFRWGYQEETMQSLFNVQADILGYQLTSLEGIIKQELDDVNTAIAKKQHEIRSAVRGKIESDMLTLELELKALLLSRIEILKSITQADEKLTALYQEEAQQQAKLSEWKRNISNEVGEGVISFYFDGYEQVLRGDKLEMLTADLLTNVVRGSGTVTMADAATDHFLYRLMDDAHFYLAFLTEQSAPFRLVKGQEYTVVFAGYADRPYTGVAYSAFVSGAKVVNILEFHQPMGDLIGVRVVDAGIKKDSSGLMVPLEAIRIDEEGMPYIERKYGDDFKNIRLNILAVDDKNAIIEAANPDDILTVGIKYRKP